MNERYYYLLKDERRWARVEELADRPYSHYRNGKCAIFVWLGEKGAWNPVTSISELALLPPFPNEFALVQGWLFHA